MSYSSSIAREDTRAQDLESAVLLAYHGCTPSPAAQQKAALISLGLDMLSRGEISIVHALTRILQREGLSHE
jgi:hypothetical protein